MPLDFATKIAPANNLRLPDALTIKYGPAPLMGRFLLAADRAARRKGVWLRVRHDFDELVDLNKFYVARDLWYPLVGVVAWGGGAWVRPDFRGRRLSYLTPRVVKTYACGNWPVDWSICYIGIDNVRRGLAATYGHKNLSYSVTYPDSPHGEQVLA